MLTYKIHLIRHGMTQGNLEGRYVGRNDVPLCKEGIEEIHRTLEAYEYPTIDCVYSSPLNRARQTTQMLYPDAPVTVVEDLMELSLGDFEGQLITDLAGTPEFKAWLEDAVSNPPPNALEDARQFNARIHGALHSVFMDMTQNKYMEAAVVCHGGVISGLLSQFGFPRAPLTQWRTGNISGYTITLTTQMWMSMGAFEIVAPVGPHSDVKFLLEKK